DRPTPEALAAHLQRFKNQVQGRIVLVGRSGVVAVNLTPRLARRDEAQLQQRYDAAQPAVQNAAAGGRDTTDPPPMANNEINRRVDEFLLANGALMRVNDAARELGQITALHNTTFDITRALPTVVMRNEDFGRISR